MAGVPWYFDEKMKCYRVRKGFKMPGDLLDASAKFKLTAPDLVAMQRVSGKLRDDLERAAATANEFYIAVTETLKRATEG